MLSGCVREGSGNMGWCEDWISSPLLSTQWATLYQPKDTSGVTHTMWHIWMSWGFTLWNYTGATIQATMGECMCVCESDYSFWDDYLLSLQMTTTMTYSSALFWCVGTRKGVHHKASLKKADNIQSGGKYIKCLFFPVMRVTKCVLHHNEDSFCFIWTTARREPR